METKKQTFKKTLFIVAALIATLACAIYINSSKVSAQTDKFIISHEAIELNGRTGWSITVNTSLPEASRGIPFKLSNFLYPANTNFSCTPEYADLPPSHNEKWTSLDLSSTDMRYYKIQKFNFFLRRDSTTDNRDDYELKTYYNDLFLQSRQQEIIDEDLQINQCFIVSEKNGDNQVIFELALDVAGQTTPRLISGSSAATQQSPDTAAPVNPTPPDTAAPVQTQAPSSTSAQTTPDTTAPVTPTPGTTTSPVTTCEAGKTLNTEGACVDNQGEEVTSAPKTGILDDDNNWSLVGYVLLAVAVLGAARILIVKKYKQIS